MVINRTEIEIRYQETDQMGVVYHANYLVWFEIGRAKLIEQLGFKYTEMEQDGVVSPVIDLQISYKKPARYGNTVFIETWLDKYDGIRTTYKYRVVDEKDEVYVTGASDHVIVDHKTFRPLRLRKVHPKWHEAYQRLVSKEG